MATASMSCRKFIRSLYEEESGQDLLEYALVLATVLSAIVTGSNAVATMISSAFTTVMGKVQSVVQ